MGKSATQFYDWEKDDADEFVDVEWFGRVFDQQDADLNDLAQQVGEIETALQGKQAVDDDLTAISALDSTSAGLLGGSEEGWSVASYDQVKASLSLDRSDVGLSNVDNTSDSAKPVSDAQLAELELAVSPRKWGASGDGSTDDHGALNAMLAEIPAGSIIDLGGRSFFVSAAWNINKRIEVRNGRIVSSGTRTVIINSAQVKTRNVEFERLTNVVSGGDDGVAVYAQGSFWKSFECDFISSGRQPLYIKHGGANYSYIKGGSCSATPDVARQDLGGIYVASGMLGNLGIVFDGIRVPGNGVTSMGINIYDATDCTVRNCDVSGIRQVPDWSISGGWSNTGGSVYSIADRTDGNTRVVIVGSTEYTENTSTPSTPGPNQWGIAGGTLFLNLNGTNPNTVTVVSRIVSGYGIMFYSSANGYLNMSDNVIAGNRITDTDGFGIYYQLGMVGAARNVTSHNKLKNVCLKGRQSNKLPFSGIGFIGGSDTLMAGDTVDRAGTALNPVPAVKINPDNTSFTSSGRIIGMQVSNCAGDGITATSGQWTLIGCKSRNNAQSGFAMSPSASTDVLDWELIGCEATANGVHGVTVDGSTNTGGVYRVSVLGGRFFGNASRNIAFKNARSAKAFGCTVHSPGTGQYNIRVDTSCTHVIIDDITMYSGNGVQVVDNTSTDIFIGKLTSDQTSANQLNLGTGVVVRTNGTSYGPAEFMGSGTPEGSVSAAVSSRYVRTDGAGGTCFYVKESGSGATGWVAK